MTDMISRLVMKVDDWVEPIAQAKGDLIDLDATTKSVFTSIKQAMQLNRGGQSPYKALLGGAGNDVNTVLFNPHGLEGGDRRNEILTTLYALTKRAMGAAQEDAAVQGTHAQTIQRVTAASLAASAAHRDNADATGVLSTVSRATGMDLADLAGFVGKKAVLGYLAYKLGIEEVIQASRSHLAENSALRQSVGGVLSSVQDLTSTITGAFISGVKASLMSVVELTTGYSSFEDMVNDGAATVAGWANSATAAIKSVNAQAKDLALIGSTALAVFHGADASAFEEGQALNQLAEATANVIQKQEQQRASLDYINNAAQGAASSQKTAAEVARIAAIDSVAALEQELQNIKLKALEQDKSVTSSKAWQQQITQITAAIEKQRAAIEGGTFKPKDSGVDQQIKAAEEALNRLAVGETNAALAIAAANGASDEQLSRLRAALVATDDLTRAKKQQEEAERKAADAQRDAAAKFAQGKNTIQSLRDEIDLLTGAATKSEVAARKLMSEGYDTAQIEEITRLTEQLEQLKAGKSGSKSDRQGNNVAAEKGSAEANAIVLRGVGGSSGNKSEKLQEQTVKGLQEVVKAIKETKPAIELQTADI